MSATGLAKSALVGLSSLVTSSVVAITLPQQLTEAHRMEIVWAMVVSASGGFFVAIIPLGEKTWSWTVFVKLTVMGAVVGYPTYAILSHPYFNLIDSVKGGVEFVVGMMAYPIAIRIQRSDPWKLVSAFWRLIDKIHPPTPSGGD